MSHVAVVAEPAVNRCVRLMLQLHDLDVQGKGSSPAAAQACAEMERPWFELSEQEQERVGGLSEDLYALAEKKGPDANLSPVEVAQWKQLLGDAYHRGAWDGLLALLRQAPREVPPQVIPFLQARAWENLGHLDVALRFMERAAELEPDDRVMVLIYLEKLGREEEATAYAHQLLNDAGAQADALYMASARLFASTRRMSAAEARPIFERIVSAMTRALSMIRNLPRRHQDFARGAESSIICMLGLCSERLGDTEAAVAVYDQALARNPALADVWLFKGISLARTDPDAAGHCFRMAIHLGTDSVWPHYYLAHQALEQGDYVGCLPLAITVSQRRAPEKVLAQAHEWVGICRCMLGHPDRYIRESFQQALVLDPDSERIRQNQATAETFLAARSASPSPDWYIPPGRSLTDIEQEEVLYRGNGGSRADADLAAHRMEELLAAG
jgi:tetratricopeptide (TPR) repeat protein